VAASIAARLLKPSQLVGDQAGQGQRGGGGGGGGVANVQRPLCPVDDEVVDQAPVAAQRLGADPRRPGFDVGGAVKVGFCAAYGDGFKCSSGLILRALKKQAMTSSDVKFSMPSAGSEAAIGCTNIQR